MSVDHIFTQNVFEATLGTLPYPLVSDWHKTTAKRYGVFEEKDEIANRSVFLINKQRKLVYKNEAFDADYQHHYDLVYEECSHLAQQGEEKDG